MSPLAAAATAALLVASAARAQVPTAPPPTSATGPQVVLERISRVRVDVDGDGMPDRTGDTVAVAGRASVGSGILHRENLQVFIQGHDAGLMLFAWSIGDPIAAGDSVEAVGTLAQYEGLTQLQVLRYRVIDAPRVPPEPLRLGLPEVPAEAYEGRLVRTRGRVVARRAVSGGEILLLSAPSAEEALVGVYIAAYRAPNLHADIAPGEEVLVTGVLGQYDRTPPYDGYYQIYPRDAADLRAVGIGPSLYKQLALVSAALLLLGLLWAATLHVQVKRRTLQLRESEERYRLLVEHSPEPIAVYQDEHVVYANGAGISLVGAESAADVVGRPLRDFVPSPQARGAPVRKTVGGSTTLTVIEDRVQRLDGSVVEVEAVSIPVTWRGKAARQVVLRDISARRQTDARLLHDAFHDSLTGLPNRALFYDRLDQAIRHRRRNPGYGFAVLFLDLDRFKIVNDSLGHLKGDELLVQIGGRIQTCLREGDTVARLGGDEFAVLADEVEDLGDATRVADRILEELRAPTQLDGHEIVVGASIGIALSFTGYDRPEELLRDADTAMYRAKAAGIGGYEVFDREMHASAVALLRMESDLRRALERDELRVHYQPIIGLETGTLEGFEALLRWEHPERGLILPAEFIRVAEETGLILPMGRIVLEQACAQLRAWREHAVPVAPLSVHVNLSGRQLSQPDLVKSIEEVLGQTGVSASEVKVEITESVVMRDAVHAAGTLGALNELGVQVCIDDFGTGYSSLSYLNRFPVDVLKVDRSFVSGGKRVSWDIVRAILTLARDMGKRVIAEGVETPEQLGALRALGAPSAQGFIFSPAVPPAATRGIVEAWDLGARSRPGAPGPLDPSRRSDDAGLREPQAPEPLPGRVGYG